MPILLSLGPDTCDGFRCTPRLIVRRINTVVRQVILQRGWRWSGQDAGVIEGAGPGEVILASIMH